MDQAADTLAATGLDDVPGADHVGPVELLIGAPDPRFGGDVVDDVAAVGSPRHGFGIAKLTAAVLHAQGRKLGMLAAGKGADLVPPRPEQFHDRLAEKSAASGDQCLHLSSFAAQTASFSRNIFAL